MKARSWIVHGGKSIYFPTGVAMPTPWVGSPSQPVDVHKGTMKMECGSLNYRFSEGSN